MSDSEEHMEKVFKDAVHGSISFPSVCVAVIDTPQFQRLRFIKQLGTTCYVYPSASHTRFEHSLGVCHLARQMVGALKRRQPELEITRRDELCVMLAGLCHDLGHGPFSHVWEAFVNRANNNDPKWKHEETSADMFEHIVKKNPRVQKKLKEHNLNEGEVQFIMDLIRQRETETSDKIGDNSTGGATAEDIADTSNKKKAFLYEIVNNEKTGVDVDKWDYILRDSHSLGIKVTFDYQRVIQFSRVITDKTTGRTHICVRDKEEDNLYDMYHARFSLHRKAYQHRVTQTIQVMLVDAFTYANDHIKYKGENGNMYALADVCKDMDAYTHLTDEVFQRILQSENTHDDMKKAKMILNNINNRQLYRYVGRTLSTNTDDDTEQLKKIAAEQDLIIKEVKFNYGKGPDNPIEKVGFYSKYSPDIITRIDKKKSSAMLPSSFEENFNRVLWKDNEDFEAVTKKFKGACDQFEIKLELAKRTQEQ